MPRLSAERRSLVQGAHSERLPARPSTDLREEIFKRGSNPSEVWHACTARVGRAIAHLLGCLAARLSHSSLPLEPLSLLSAPFAPSLRQWRTEEGALARCSSTTSSPKHVIAPPHRPRAGSAPSPRVSPLVGPHATLPASRAQLHALREQPWRVFCVGCWLLAVGC